MVSKKDLMNHQDGLIFLSKNLYLLVNKKFDSKKIKSYLDRFEKIKKVFMGDASVITEELGDLKLVRAIGAEIEIIEKFRNEILKKHEINIKKISEECHTLDHTARWVKGNLNDFYKSKGLKEAKVHQGDVIGLCRHIEDSCEEEVKKNKQKGYIKHLKHVISLLAADIKVLKNEFGDFAPIREINLEIDGIGVLKDDIKLDQGKVGAKRLIKIIKEGCRSLVLLVDGVEGILENINEVSLGKMDIGKFEKKCKSLIREMGGEKKELESVDISKRLKELIQNQEELRELCKYLLESFEEKFREEDYITKCKEEGGIFSNIICYEEELEDDAKFIEQEFGDPDLVYDILLEKKGVGLLKSFVLVDIKKVKPEERDKKIVDTIKGLKSKCDFLIKFIDGVEKEGEEKLGKKGGFLGVLKGATKKVHS